MSTQDIRQWVVEYGHDLSTWPEAVQQKYQQLTLSQPEMTRVLEEEAALFSKLQNLHQPVAPANFEQRILDEAFSQPQESHVRIGERLRTMVMESMYLLQISRPALTAALLLLIGVAGGFELSTQAQSDPATLLTELYYMERDIL